MAWLSRGLVRSIFVAPLVLLCACDQVRRVLPGQEDVKYELKQDSQGRTVRLNKSTGEVVIIDGTVMTPVKESKAEARANLPKSSAGTPASRQSPGVASKPPAANAVRSTASAVSPEASPGVPAAPPGGSRLMITSQTAILAERTRRPLTQLARGTVVTLVRSSGANWYNVRFEDPTRGLFFGLVDKRFVSVVAPQTDAAGTSVGRGEPNRNTPMDLSIREAKPTSNEPIDLSIPAQKLQPVDLSVPASQSKSSEPIDLSVPSKADAQTPERTATTNTTAPVFASQNENQEPLRVAREGSVLVLLEQLGDWCRVEFQDPEFGGRVGYVQRKFVRIGRPISPVAPQRGPLPQPPAAATVPDRQTSKF